jgi:hypothetical protein
LKVSTTDIFIVCPGTIWISNGNGEHPIWSSFVSEVGRRFLLWCNIANLLIWEIFASHLQRCIVCFWRRTLRTQGGSVGCSILLKTFLVWLIRQGGHWIGFRGLQHSSLILLNSTQLCYMDQKYCLSLCSCWNTCF